jgi:ligand-binding sensor domain-containing protein
MDGYWLVSDDGRAWAFDGSPWPSTLAVRAGVVAAAGVGPSLWVVAGDGTVVDGDTVVAVAAPQAGRRIVALVVAPSRGVWVVDDAGAAVSVGGAPPLPTLASYGVATDRVVAAAASPAGGLWLAADDGAVYALGGCEFHGSLPSLGVSGARIAAIAPTSSGGGYWLLGRDGGVFAFGDAPFLGGLCDLGLRIRSAVALLPADDGAGYAVVTAAGAVVPFGTARHLGSLSSLDPSAAVRVVAAVARRAWATHTAGVSAGWP